MFLKQIKDDIQSLKGDVIRLKNDVGLNEEDTPYDFRLLCRVKLTTRIEDIEKNIQRLFERLEESSNKFDVLLKHFGIEYVEITEKNGGTKVIKKYRKAKKAGKTKRAQRDYGGAYYHRGILKFKN